MKGVKVTPQEIAHCLSAKNMAKCPLPRSRRKLGTDSVCKNTVLSTRGRDEGSAQSCHVTHEFNAQQQNCSQ